VAMEHRRSHGGEGGQSVSEASEDFIGISRPSEISQHRNLAAHRRWFYFDVAMSVIQDKDQCGHVDGPGAVVQEGGYARCKMNMQHRLCSEYVFWAETAS